MNIKRTAGVAVATIVAGVAGVGVLLVAPGAAQARPSSDCAFYAAAMQGALRLGHAARIRGDYVTWQAYQTAYEYAYYEAQDAGC
jgi:hypothetical protein